MGAIAFTFSSILTLVGMGFLITSITGHGSTENAETGMIGAVLLAGAFLFALLFIGARRRRAL
jgi:hypothetical protein